MRSEYKDLCELYEASVKRFASRPLFGVREARGWHWLSYRDFASKVETLRAALLQGGLQRGDRVALIAPNGTDWAAVAFATFTAGGVLVPVYPFQRYDDWLEILRDANPRFVFTHNIEAASAVHGWRADLDPSLTLVCLSHRRIAGAVSLDELTEKALWEARPVVRPRPSDLATLIYTSGTMGRPKGVELTHANLISNLNGLRRIFPVTAEDRSLSYLPWAHAFGQVVELYGMFSMGASMALAPSEEDIMKSLLEVRPSLIFSVPKLFNRIYDTLQERIRERGALARRLFDDGLDNARIRRRVRNAGKARGTVELKAKLYERFVFNPVRQQFGGQVRYAVCGGAALPPEVAEFVDSLGITLYEGYGLTECSPIVSANWPGARKLGSVGKPLPSVRVLVDYEVGPNTRDGEIIVYGPNVMRAYHNQPEESAFALTRDGGLRTGDLGYIDKDGFLFVTGRIKEQYKLDNGRYVVPTPLEAELRSSRYVRSAMVYGDGRPYNIALIVPDLDELRGWAAENQVRAPDVPSLLRHPEVEKLYAAEIERYSESFREYERVRAFVLLERDFTVEDGTLTHTQKIRRREVTMRYARLVDELYGGSRGAAALVD
ncbi:MAG TPA: long-chain fatty acid--CoA ligase [Polyangiales bacterium]|nr:long-chain fatty acid--CoA ligase [Polyangiales bacterium]